MNNKQSIVQCTLKKIIKHLEQYILNNQYSNGCLQDMGIQGDTVVPKIRESRETFTYYITQIFITTYAVKNLVFPKGRPGLCLQFTEIISKSLECFQMREVSLFFTVGPKAT